MPRVKRGVGHAKKKKKLMSKVKGYKWGRSHLLKVAKVATLRAGAYAYKDRRNKKRSMRRLWQIRINAAVRNEGITYSRFIDVLKKANIELDRKVMSEMALNKPAAFKALVKSLTK